MKRVCVFAGSSSGRNPLYAKAAQELGAVLASRHIGLVYGGARVGLMGAMADAVLAGGGEVVGVIPNSLVEKEVAHTGLTSLRVVRSMHERKALMAEMADAFVALPGGWGTLDEMFEILTLMQTEKLAKQIQIILYGSEYWDPVLSLQPMAEWGAISPGDIDLIQRVDTPEQAFELLKAHLTEHHLLPPTPQEMKAPGIAKTRS